MSWSIGRFGWLVLIVAGLLLKRGTASVDYVDYVDPLIGTAKEGNCFPGPCRPFGMVQASPDTGCENHRCAGFDYDDVPIRCFSQTHANGIGRPALGDGALMPFTGETDGIDYSSPYDRKRFKASPDFLFCELTRFGVKVEVTTSERTAWYRFIFPSDKAAKVLVDTSAVINQGYNIKLGPPIRDVKTVLSELRTEIAVERRLRIWEEGTVCFVYCFSKPWRSVRERPTDRLLGKGARYELEFGVLDEPLEVKVAVSSVSVDGARNNMEKETSNETFETVRKASWAVWNELLSRMMVEDCSDKVKRNWYTSIYHLCIQPNLYSDVDGRYRADDGQIKVGPNGRMYTMFSLWDTFRAAHPLYTILVPERVQGFVESLWRQGEDHGHLPMWVMWGRETHSMIGVHSIPVLVDAYEKGWHPADGDVMLDSMISTLTGFDAESPKNAFGLIYDYGYVAYDPGPFCKDFHEGSSVSRNMELAYDWWCVARFARLLGNEVTACRADKYAGIWRNLYDAKSGFMRAKSVPFGPDKGMWREPFAPLENRQAGNFWGDYTEANAYVYTWHVFQEPMELVALLGGAEIAKKRLDEFFAKDPMPGKVASGNNDEGGVLRSGQIGQYWHGNEPSHHIAYFYSILGESDRAADVIRRVCDEAYVPKPDGLCGNDDCGQMSAWYLFSMMGFYPFNPCGGEYVIGAPQVPRVTIRLKSGRLFTVIAKNLSRMNRYVKSAILVPSGSRHCMIAHVSIRHSDVITGGELVFEMTDKEERSECVSK